MQLVLSLLWNITSDSCTFWWACVIPWLVGKQFGWYCRK